MPDSLSDAALTVHAAAACFMAGVIWIVQVVHYPLMRPVMRMASAEQFVGFALAHQRRITPIVAPAILFECVATATVLVLGHGEGQALRWCAAGLMAITLGMTFGVMVPLHARLAQRPDPAVLERLITLNWVRTVAWSARALIGVAMLA